MLCPNCGYNNEAAPSTDKPCAFCEYRGTEAPAAPAIIPTPAIPAVWGAVEAPPVVEAANDPRGEAIAL